MQHMEGSGSPSYIQDARFLKVNVIRAFPTVWNEKVSTSENTHIDLVSSLGTATSKDAPNTEKYTVEHEDQAKRCQEPFFIS